MYIVRKTRPRSVGFIEKGVQDRRCQNKEVHCLQVFGLQNDRFQDHDKSSTRTLSSISWHIIKNDGTS